VITVKDFSTIISPVYTEKATSQTEAGKYIFKVAIGSGKVAVKVAIERIFGVEVTSVNILNSKPKTKVFKGVRGKRKSYKKAIITLKKGSTIDLTKGA
jgi:large subunit ribosomal protein L23